jgi:hypothetical protein
MKHGLLAVFYGPINKLDRDCFGGSGPLGCIMTGIGEKKK